MTLSLAGGPQSHVGGKGKNNAAVTTDGSTVTKVTLGAEPNHSLAYAVVLEIHQPNMSKLWARGLFKDRGERERVEERISKITVRIIYPRFVLQITLDIMILYFVTIYVVVFASPLLVSFPFLSDYYFYAIFPVFYAELYHMRGVCMRVGGGGVGSHWLRGGVLGFVLEVNNMLNLTCQPNY